MLSAAGVPLGSHRRYRIHGALQRAADAVDGLREHADEERSGNMSFAEAAWQGLAIFRRNIIINCFLICLVAFGLNWKLGRPVNKLCGALRSTCAYVSCVLTGISSLVEAILHCFCRGPTEPSPTEPNEAQSSTLHEDLLSARGYEEFVSARDQRNGDLFMGAMIGFAAALLLF